MSEKTDSIQVLVHPIGGEAQKGLLKYWKEGPEIELENGVLIRGDSGASFRHLKHTSNLPVLKKTDFVSLKPILVTEMDYSTHPIGIDMMYPPSSDRWILHVVEDENKAVFTVQPLTTRDRYLLSISDINTGSIIKAYLIHNYEISLLSMKNDIRIHKDLFERNLEQPDIESLLDSKSPSWPFISSLVEDVTIPNLTLKDTMRETLQQLVPRSFPQTVRDQILAFLAWLASPEIPVEDPLDFRTKLASVNTFRFLVVGHLVCMIDNISPPSYVRIMMLAARGMLKSTDQPLPEADLENSWIRAEVEIQEQFPDMMKRVTDYAQALNTQGEILTHLPISRKDAEKSKSLWIDRLVLSRMGLFMRGHIQRKSLGLTTTVYFGAAHKWPHKHLELSARLGYQTTKPPQVQIMVMPPNAVERVSRLLERIHVIDWEMSSLNFAFYKSNKRKWSINNSIILKSLERKRSLRQLRNEFGGGQSGPTITINEKQAKILDLFSWGMFLASLETNVYSKYLRIDNETIRNELNHLKELGLFSLQFSSILEKLTSVCVLAEGPSSSICSLSRAFLKHAPSADVRITKDGSTSLIMSRIPNDDTYRLLTALPKVAEENDVRIRALPISAYIGYRHDLHQRLLKEDGSWDDDISGLISQSKLHLKDYN